MIRNKMSIERQFDERLYQFLAPHEGGNWNEILAFAQDIVEFSKKQLEISLKKKEEEIIVEPKAE